MTPVEYLKTRAQFQAEFDKNLKALNLIWAAQTNGAPPPEPINGHEDAVNAVRGAWRQVARQVIDEMPSGKQFVVRDVETALQEKNPLITTDRVAISVFLKSLADSKEIEIFELGAGRRATIFAKP